MIDYFTGVAKGKVKLKDFNMRLGACEFQAAWEVNPKVCTIAMEGEEKDLRLHESLGLFYKYLTACEHEFYKQMLSNKFEKILFDYERQLGDARWRKEKPERKLPEHGLIEPAYNYKMMGLTDNIYYRRGRDYLFECDKFWIMLGKNQFSAKYLLNDGDVAIALKKI
jgi:hypothetical protein